ncbi:hypothetical protein DUNSADRAFT_12011, partial [Dunaliella salina]
GSLFAEQAAHARGQALAERVARELEQGSALGSNTSSSSDLPGAQQQRHHAKGRKFRHARQSNSSSDYPYEHRRQLLFGLGSLRYRRSSTGSSLLDSEAQIGSGDDSPGGWGGYRGLRPFNSLGRRFYRPASIITVNSLYDANGDCADDGTDGSWSVAPSASNSPAPARLHTTRPPTPTAYHHSSTHARGLSWLTDSQLQQHHARGLSFADSSASVHSARPSRSPSAIGSQSRSPSYFHAPSQFCSPSYFNHPSHSRSPSYATTASTSARTNPAALASKPPSPSFQGPPGSPRLGAAHRGPPPSHIAGSQGVTRQIFSDPVSLHGLESPSIPPFLPSARLGRTSMSSGQVQLQTHAPDAHAQQGALAPRVMVRSTSSRGNDTVTTRNGVVWGRLGNGSGASHMGGESTRHAALMSHERTAAAGWLGVQGMTREEAWEYLRTLARTPLPMSSAADSSASLSMHYPVQGWCSLGDGDDLVGWLPNPPQPAWSGQGAGIGPHGLQLQQQQQQLRSGPLPRGPARGLNFREAAPEGRDTPLDTVEEQATFDGERARLSTRRQQQQQQQQQWRQRSSEHQQQQKQRRWSEQGHEQASNDGREGGRQLRQQSSTGSSEQGSDNSAMQQRRRKYALAAASRTTTTAAQRSSSIEHVLASGGGIQIGDPSSGFSADGSPSAEVTAAQASGGVLGGPSRASPPPSWPAISRPLSWRPTCSSNSEGDGEEGDGSNLTLPTLAGHLPAVKGRPGAQGSGGSSSSSLPSFDVSVYGDVQRGSHGQRSLVQ